jgi:hypothetical protein
MGVKVHDAHHGFLYCEVDKIKGCEIQLDFPSVGATENIMLTAVFAEGDTVIRHAAKEPEIVDLQQFLVEMGVDVSGAGSSTIRIRGKNERLKNVEHTVIPDRIVAGTYLVAAGITGGDLNLRNVSAEHIMSVVSYLREAGCRVNIKKNNIHVSGPARPRAISSLLSLAAFSPISGLAPAPSPFVNLSPIWILVFAFDKNKACLSVLIAINSTPRKPAAIILLTALFPPPPTPTTLIWANCSISISNSSNLNPPFFIGNKPTLIKSLLY